MNLFKVRTPYVEAPSGSVEDLDQSQEHPRDRRDLLINYPNCILAVCRNLQVQIIRVASPEKQGCQSRYY